MPHNGSMDIAAVNDFAATPERVFDMLTDPDFLDRVCRATSPLEYEVYVEGPTAGTRRVMKAPSSVVTFTGPTITVRDEIAWHAPASGPERSGTATIKVEGVPVALHGRVRLSAGGRGTILDYAGHLKVSIPFVGPKLETQAAPLLLEALKVQQRVGDDYLSA